MLQNNIALEYYIGKISAQADFIYLTEENSKLHNCSIIRSYEGICREYSFMKVTYGIYLRCLSTLKNPS